MQRDKESAAAADRLIASQLGREERLARADDVIENAGSPGELRAAVETVHERYLDLALRVAHG
jgi:dephospho-CoA kinase